MSTKIIIDSACDLTKEEADKLGVILVPMIIRFDDDEYLDGFNISKQEFYEKLIENANLPKTSQINPERFKEEYEKVVSNGDEAVVITISSKLSGTYSSAVKASAEYKDKIFVVDSLNASLGERLLFNYAYRLLNEGKNAKEIASELEKAKKRLNLLAMLDTLKYLRKGGRISALVAFAGEMMSIKPVIAVKNGEVKLVGKAIGSKKAGNLLNKLVSEKGIDFEMPYCVAYSGLSNQLLEKYVTDSEALYKDHTNDIPRYAIGSTIGTHVGPNAIGVAFFSKEEK